GQEILAPIGGHQDRRSEIGHRSCLREAGQGRAVRRSPSSAPARPSPRKSSPSGAPQLILFLKCSILKRLLDGEIPDGNRCFRPAGDGSPDRLCPVPRPAEQDPAALGSSAGSPL